MKFEREKMKPIRSRSVVRLLALGMAQCLALAFAVLSNGEAKADVCFRTPIAVPGLSGPPAWVGAGTLRDELDEPRWGAAPLTGFATDPTDLEGGYRILVDAAFTQLTVSLQALAEPNVATIADSVYFGFSTSATSAQVVKITLPSGAPAGGHTPVTSGTYYTYSAGTWTAALGLAGATWLVDPAGWSNAPAGADWAVNLKVDLTQAGIAPGSAFKIFLGVHMADEVGTNTINLTTPDPGSHPLHTGTLFTEDPNFWAPALAANAGCADGVEIFGSNLGTLNTKLGMPAPNSINTTLGATNRFFATPTYPASLLVFPGMIQGNFRIANWGSIASPAAAWPTIPNGGAVQNGVAPSPDAGTLQFDCPTNTAGQTCGMATPGVSHQCMMVELQETPGNTVPITRAAAYTNMTFEPLSVLEDTAEISVKGLRAITGIAKDRDVYIYVHPKNLPPHGDKPLWLPNAAMQKTRVEFYNPPARPRIGERPPQNPNDANGGKAKPKISTKVAPNRSPALKPGSPIAPSPSALPEVPQAPQPAANPAVTENRELAAQNGNGAQLSSMAPFQKLTSVWPTYDVHVYYDTGKVFVEDGVTYRQLQPMYPFTYFLSHDGPLFGFTHALRGAPGVALEELRPNVYRVRVPDEGSVKLQASISAEEKPKQPVDVCTNCPSGNVPPVEKDCHCNCEVIGARVPNLGGTGWLSVGFAIAASVHVRRRRRTS
jgi:hypothetical protein